MVDKYTTITTTTTTTTITTNTTMITTMTVNTTANTTTTNNNNTSTVTTTATTSTTTNTTTTTPTNLHIKKGTNTVATTVMITIGTTIANVYNKIHIYISSSEASNHHHEQVNTCYGMTLANADSRHVHQPGTKLTNAKDELNTLTTMGNIYNTVNSGIYFQLNEAEMVKY